MATNGAAANDEYPLSKFNGSSTIPLWLDGKEVTTSKTFDVTSPVTNEVLYKAAAASEDDATAAIASAEKAGKMWSKTKPSVRRDIFLRAGEELAKRKEECFQYSRRETGTERSMFELEFALTLEACKTIAGLIPTVQGTIPTVAEEGSSAMVFREPYGVVLGIVPWNAPYVLGVRAFLTPLATGNTVILKGSESSPGVFWALASAFHAAGLPDGCLNTIYHRPADASAVTTALIASPAVKKINFTGSTAVGSIIASLAGKYLKPVLMELGGKAPSIVCEDANLQTAALQCALGAFLHGGQICMATERILVHRSIALQFKEALTAAMDQVFGGQGKDAVVLINAAPVEKNKKLLKDAIDKGARAIYGDINHNDDSKTRMRPVIIENVKEGMDIYHTESFGPTVSVYEVDSDEEAIRIANDTDYGLSSAVFTEDLRRGLKIAKQIETGAVHINSMTVHDEVALPHGGAKKSGFGRFSGREGLEEWVRTKTVTWKD
jgi:acyl-CoA reductase-like NAD-dependent aldehyde dehydrogenase